MKDFCEKMLPKSPYFGKNIGSSVSSRIEQDSLNF
jgi:hypothetical protein